MFILKIVKIMEIIEKKDKKLDKSKARKEAAVKNVINDILNGGVFSVLVSKLQNDEYGLGYCYSRPQSDRIIREARNVIKKDVEEQLPNLRDDMISRLLDVYTECRDCGDRYASLKALDQLNKLCGLYENKVKLDCDISGDVNINFDFNKE